MARLTLREWSAVISATFVVIGTIWYIFLAIAGKIRPVLASWIVIGTTMVLSFATYWTTPNHSLVANACNAASVLSAVSILLTVVWLQGGSATFSHFQKWSLAVAGVIGSGWVLLVWGFGGTGVVPNILTQVLMLIGYVVTAEKVWRSEKNSESFFMWWCITIGSAVALYTSLMSNDMLAFLYAARATLASATLLGLMYRVEWKCQRVECV